MITYYYTTCRPPMRLALSLVALVVASPAGADDFKPAKARELSAATEAAWVAAVQNTKTEDGTTVLQALRYAEKLRPSKFKVGAFEAGYNGGSGEPEAISIDFWIGAKREPGDSFSIMFAVKSEGGRVVVERPKPQTDGTAAEATISGRDGLLHFIDEQYRENCIDVNNGAKLC